MVYYEFYLDIYFLENLVINFFILCLARAALSSPKAFLRLFAAALAGAAAESALMILPLNKSALWVILGGIAVTGGTAALGMGWQSGQWKRNLGFFYGCAFIYLSILQLLREYILAGFFGSAVSAFFISMLILRAIMYLRAGNAFLYHVRLEEQGKEVCVEALYDSGNRLYQPLTGRPVQILNLEAAKELLKEEEREELLAFLEMRTEVAPSGRFTYIPYHSVGKKRGLLPAMKIEKMDVTRGREHWCVRSAVIAVSDSPLSSKNEYQMILNSELLEGHRNTCRRGSINRAGGKDYDN